MALSDEERRRLEILEQELAASDPDFVRKLQAGTAANHGRQPARVVRGVLIMIAAFTLIITGIAAELTIIGAAGFLLMIAGAAVFLKRFNLQRGPKDPP